MSDVLEIVALYSIKESFAKETIDKIVEIFSSFKNRAGQLEMKEDFVSKIDKSTRLNFK